MPNVINNPKVSILCLAYNHEAFLRQCLDGFIKQKTDFPFEVLIHDDASTDGTADIIREYERKYPDIIKPIYQKQNQYSQGISPTYYFQLPRAKGQYIALCEGDDYWVDPYKLQMQVDFLDKNLEYSVCFHAARVVYENGQLSDFIYPDVPDLKWYTKYELLKTNYIPTNAVVYRRQEYKNMPDHIQPGDWYMHLYHASKGKIKYLNKVLSVYRKHEGGMWWDYDQNRDRIWLKYGIAHLRMHSELLKVFSNDPKALGIIEENMIHLLKEFTQMDQKKGSNILEQSLETYPGFGAKYITLQQKEIAKYQKEARRLWRAIHQQDKILAHKQTLVEQKQKEIEEIKSKKKLRRVKSLVKKATKH